MAGMKSTALKRYLDARGESYAEFARRLGVSPSQISRIANDERAPSAPLVASIHKETGGAVPFDSWAHRRRQVKAAHSSPRRASRRKGAA